MRRTAPRSAPGVDHGSEEAETEAAEVSRQSLGTRPCGCRVGDRTIGQVALVDRELARLRAYLDRKGLSDDTYIILSADHGEAFGEHASYGHAKTVYEEQSHVPFFFFLPGRGGQRIDTPITLMDVGPTVLDLFGLPTPGHWMSQSLLPLVADRQAMLDRVVAMDTGRNVQAVYFEDRYKVIFSRNRHTTECYDLKSDPGELNNLVGIGDARAQEAVAAGNLFFARVRRPGGGSPAEVGD
jgi:arylsulfatase A-like enzyme